ncbi:hypothetical protein HAX54_008457 [Datura stramonium]|uniref:Uncharacterized protein n=1 Tax=Datura stramonium TaxID=4076 RepID=A0ABS8TFY5_DATST|nr:hypothetical protein [Datura stramonium]
MGQIFEKQNSKLQKRDLVLLIGDLSRHHSIRTSSKKVMEEELKENQEKTTRQRKLKERSVVEDDVQTENVFDPKGGEVEKEIDDYVALGIMLRHEKTVSKYSIGGKVQKAMSIPKNKGSKKSILTGSMRKQREVSIDEVRDEPVDSSKQRKAREGEGFVAERTVPLLGLLRRKQLPSLSLKQKDKLF